MRMILGILITVIAGSCKTLSPSSEAKYQTQQKYDYIISQCLVPQGNGGNWASTLGWMSATLEQRHQEGLKLTNKGQKVGFFLGCMAGGSSGSVATVLYMNLLTNSNLVPSSEVSEILNLEELENVYRALRFISISADLNQFELLNFYRQFIVENIKGFASGSLSNSQTLKNISRNILGNTNPSWWNGQVVDADQMLVDFLVMVKLASTIKIEHVNGEIKELIPANLHSIVEDYNLKKITDLASFGGYDQVPTKESKEGEVLSKLLEAQTKAINSLADQFLASQFRLGEYKSRYYRGPWESAPDPLLSLANLPLREGFCSIVMAQITENESLINLDLAPNYNQLKAVYLCDSRTIQRIIAMPKYTELKSSLGFDRYLLAEPKEQRVAMALSIREPGLMAELKGQLGKKPFFLNNYLDSTTDQFKMFSREGVAIAGGFPDRRITAWPIALWYSEKIKELAHSANVKPYLTMFGKPDNRDQDKFDTKSIREVFSMSPEDGQKNVNHWFAWQDSFCKTTGLKLEAIGTKIETVAYNWDIRSLPAAQAKASAYLTVKSINATRAQLGDQGLEYVFDPEHKQGYINILDSIPCTN